MATKEEENGKKNSLSQTTTTITDCEDATAGKDIGSVLLPATRDATRKNNRGITN